jgi:hypothetical protein
VGQLSWPEKKKIVLAPESLTVSKKNIPALFRFVSADRFGFSNDSANEVTNGGIGAWLKKCLAHSEKRKRGSSECSQNVVIAGNAGRCCSCGRCPAVPSPHHKTERQSQLRIPTDQRSNVLPKPDERRKSEPIYYRWLKHPGDSAPEG